MTASTKSRRSTTLQTVGVIAAALGVIALSIVGTLTFSGNFNLSGSGYAGGEEFRNVSMTDAQLACEERARSQFGARLKLITPDIRSSRFDEKANRYRMYFELDMLPLYGANPDSPVTHFLNCFVHGEKGRVTHFESVQDKNEGIKPIRQNEGGIWGL